MADILVQLSNVTRSFTLPDGEVPAVSGIDCAVRDKDRIAVMGPSGCGKSTLLALMAQLDEPTSGIIAWPKFPAARDLRPRDVGVAFQTASLLPALTAVENVEVPLLILDEVGQARARALAALESFELGHLADRLPDELSGGQAQRVAAVRAFVTNPRLILADEPTGQLDQATGRLVIQKLIEQSEKNGAALIVATHDFAVAKQMNEIWYMNYGKLERNRSLRVAS